MELISHWPLEVNEPDGDLSRSRLVPVHGVSFSQCDYGLKLLVMVPLSQSTNQLQRFVWILILHHLHVKVGWVSGLDVNLEGGRIFCTVLEKALWVFDRFGRLIAFLSESEFQRRLNNKVSGFVVSWNVPNKQGAARETLLFACRCLCTNCPNEGCWH